jgi:hypothetical protein
MTPTEIERVYDTLAITLDAMAAEDRDLFLAKTALLLAHELGNAERVCDLIASAAKVGSD